jgi:hypothetical protein
MTRRNVTDEQYGRLCRRTEELHRRVDEGAVDFDIAIDALQKVIEGEQIQNAFLKLISGNKSLVLDRVDGQQTLANAKDLFAHIDPDFKNWKADEKGSATPITPVQVYEMTKDATFQQMFGSLSSDSKKLCLTQSQIIEFVKKHRNWLRTDGYTTLFLFESNNQLFVAGVDVASGGALEVLVARFGFPSVWGAGGRHRLVVPQLAV